MNTSSAPRLTTAVTRTGGCIAAQAQPRTRHQAAARSPRPHRAPLCTLTAPRPVAATPLTVPRWGRSLRWLLMIAGGSAVFLAPWSAYLAATLPRHYTAAHWNIAWAGLDLMMMAGLAAAIVLTRRGDARAVFPASATSALFLLDGWFDVTTSHGAKDIGDSLLCLCGELPMAAICAVLAVTAYRRCTANR